MRRMPRMRFYAGRWLVTVMPTGDSLFGCRIMGRTEGSVGLKLAVISWMRRVPAASSWSVKLVRRTQLEDLPLPSVPPTAEDRERTRLALAASRGDEKGTG